jgi:hypothetical protein
MEDITKLIKKYGGQEDLTPLLKKHGAKLDLSKMAKAKGAKREYVDVAKLKKEILSEIPKPINTTIEKTIIQPEKTIVQVEHIDNSAFTKKLKKHEDAIKDINKNLTIKSHSSASYGGEVDKLSQLVGDVKITNPINLDNLIYNSTNGKWENVAGVSYLTKAQADTYYYPLSANPAGYLISSDLSAYVPYTGATGDVDLGNRTLTTGGAIYAGVTVLFPAVLGDVSNLRAGYFETTSSGVGGLIYTTLADGNYGGLFSVGGNKSAQIIPTVYAADPTALFVYNDNASIFRQASFANNAYAGYFTDNTNSVCISDGTYAINATGNSLFTGNVTATQLIKSGGTSSQFLKADGSVDTSTYLTSITYSKSFTITNPTTFTSTPLWRVPIGITLTATHWLLIGGTSVNGNLDELDANGLNPVVVNADVNPLAATNLNSVAFSNPGIATGNYLGVHLTTVTGIPTKLIVTYEYTIP